jgi:sirohydrochlorin cobaltochelatase
MMTRGGEHAEQDIPAALERARNRHPKEKFVYIWPFSAQNIAEFLNSQILKHS